MKTLRNIALASLAALAGFLAGGQLFQAQGADPTASADDVRFATRSTLAICVDVSGANVSAQTAAAAVRDVLVTDLNKRPGWGFLDSQARPVVVAGCPTPSRNIVQKYTHYLVGSNVNAYRTTSPSPFFVQVYVTTAGEVARIFGHNSVRTVPEEFTCDGGTCAEATTGLIIEQDMIGQRATLTRYLGEALGLVRPVGK